ncbi:MAG: ArsI/CadI family heavy metal resistance metalloenzyme [Armatimonadota bacterium]
MSGSCCPGSERVLLAEEPRRGSPRIHLSLNVRDLEASVAFYQAFLGVAPHKRRPGYANFAPDHLALKLALNELPPSGEGRTPLNHLGLQVDSPEEVQAARERFAAAGLPVYDEGDTVCCFARQDKVWVHDPDGNAWEVYVLTDDMLAEHDENAAAGSQVHSVPARLQSQVADRPRVCCEG